MAELYDGTAHYIGCDECETVVPFDEARDDDRWARVVDGIWSANTHLCPRCADPAEVRWLTKSRSLWVAAAWVWGMVVLVRYVL